MSPRKIVEIYKDHIEPAAPLMARRFEWEDDAPVDGSAEIVPIDSLEDLAAVLSGAEVSEDSEYPLDDLPTFGGEEPDDTHEVYSWDDEHLLLYDGIDGFVIEER